jgi:hypothetical protein
MTDDFDESAMFSPEVIKKPSGGNPLAAYFRVPGITITLPSKGKFYPEGAVTYTMTGDIPVYPFRAADELLMKSPEALMSGLALETMIQSCVPAISCNPKIVSVCDMDVIMLAVRAASYGNKMEIESTCPKCQTENLFECDILSLLGTATDVPDDTSVRLSADVVIYLRPHNISDLSTLQMTAFSEARAMQAVEGQSDDVKLEAMREGYRKLSELDGKITSGCMLKVVTPNGVVTNRAHILDFSKNISAEWSKKIGEKIGELNKCGVDKKIKMTCIKCEHEWDTSVEFDPTSFFGKGS